MVLANHLQASTNYMYRHGALSECLHYGIPYCLQNIVYFKIKCKIYCPMYFIYAKTSISVETLIGVFTYTL
jgi:hypothetical protein